MQNKWKRIIVINPENSTRSAEYELDEHQKLMNKFKKNKKRNIKKLLTENVQFPVPILEKTHYDTNDSTINPSFTCEADILTNITTEDFSQEKFEQNDEIFTNLETVFFPY